MMFNGVKVFAATKHDERAELGERVTEWMARHPTYEICEVTVTQSSDQAFHCIAITVFYRDPAVAARRFPPIKRAAG